MGFGVFGEMINHVSCFVLLVVVRSVLRVPYPIGCMHLMKEIGKKHDDVALSIE